MDIVLTEAMCESGSEAVITHWYQDDGTAVEAGVVIADLMVEKAQLEIVAPVSGRLEILAAVDQPLTAGAVIARIA
jgi:pyruvate/2-oxoglutarate dehydrogenase complex dihydrolipoamide acyltransferase (E2) component